MASDFDIEARIESARKKIQDYLLYECLPRMPRLAQCLQMTDPAKKIEDNERIGMWEPDKETAYTKYYNLNYTYYLLDLMVIHNTDKRFGEIIAKVDDERWNSMKRSYDYVLDDSDFKYYFGKKNEENVKDLWNNLMAQTIHASRAQYMVASRTGAKYWNAAELKIKWKHSRLGDECDEAELDRNNNPILDPSIVPMALRANTNFSYYISLQPDMEVDRLFGDICKELADHDGNDTVVNLWDDNNYNIQLTERSIEAVVDYYDYLNKYEASILNEAYESDASEEDVKVVNVPTKTAYEKAVDDKIGEYLQSEAGQKIIAQAIAKQQPAVVENQTVSAGPDVQTAIDFVTLINKKQRTKHNPNGDHYDQLMDAMESLMRKVIQCSIHKAVKKEFQRRYTNRDEAEMNANISSQEIYRQYQSLIIAMANNENLADKDNNLAYLYDVLKSNDK